MFHPQQQSQQSSFTYFAHSTGPTPNSFLQFPQPQFLPLQPPLFPPGTDPHTHSGTFTATHFEFEAQAQYNEQPNVGFGSWITTPSCPIGYNDSSSVAALNSSYNSYQMNQSLVNNVLGSAPNQTKLVQCDVCNIECNTLDVYDKHLMGKKHQSESQAQTNLATAAFQTAYTMASGVTNVYELEKKKQKLLISGAAVDSVRMCTICNVTCNSDDAFSKHLSGRRHAAQAGLIAVNGIGPYIAATRANDHFWNKGKKTTKVNQSRWCHICSINCTSIDVYAKHLAGRKHLNNLEKLQNLKNGTSTPLIYTPAATNLTIGPVGNSAPKSSSGDNVQRLEKRAAPAAAQSDAPKEDLEMKKMKVMEGGAAAAAVRICTLCNVVCNSQKVFYYHLRGQKHTAMAKKQAEATISATPQRISAA